MAGNDGARGELARVVVLLIGIVGLIALAIAAPIWILSEDIGLPSIEFGGDTSEPDAVAAEEPAPDPDTSDAAENPSLESEIDAPSGPSDVNADDLMRATVGPDASTTTTTAAPTTTSTTVPLRDEETADWLLEPTIEPASQIVPRVPPSVSPDIIDQAIADLLFRIDLQLTGVDVSRTFVEQYAKEIQFELRLAREVPLSPDQVRDLRSALVALHERYEPALHILADESSRTPIERDGAWGEQLDDPPGQVSFAIDGDRRTAFVSVTGQRLGYINAPIETFAPITVDGDPAPPTVVGRPEPGSFYLQTFVSRDDEVLLERVETICGIAETFVLQGDRPIRVDTSIGRELTEERASGPAGADIQALSIRPLGWLRDGRAALLIDQRSCVNGILADDRNGIYLLDLEGELELVVSLTGRRVWLVDPGQLPSGFDLPLPIRDEIIDLVSTANIAAANDDLAGLDRVADQAARWYEERFERELNADEVLRLQRLFVDLVMQRDRING